MGKDEIVTELVRMSIDLVVSSGKPPEEAYRLALQGMFMSMAMAVKNSDDIDHLFPMIFPMEMTLESRQLRWNFQLVLRLKNSLKSATTREEQDDT